MISLNLRPDSSPTGRRSLMEICRCEHTREWSLYGGFCGFRRLFVYCNACGLYFGDRDAHRNPDGKPAIDFSEASVSLRIAAEAKAKDAIDARD